MDKLAYLRDSSMKIEHNIIGRLILYPEKMAEISSLINSDDFSDEKSRKAFRIIGECIKGDQDVMIKFSEHGLTASDFLENDFRDLNIIAKELKRYSQAIRFNLLVLKWNGRIDNRNAEKSIADFSREFIDITRITESKSTDIKSIIRDFEAEQELYAEKYRSGEKLLGLHSGFKELDDVIDGIRPGHFWVIGGYNNTGKTFFALEIALAAVMQGKRVVIYSMEMSQKDIVGRLMGNLAEMNNNKILKGILKEDELEKQMKAKAKLWESRMSIYEDLDNYEQIKMSMYRENMIEKVDLFIIDYMQLLQANDQTEYQLMTSASREFQSMGKKNKIPIIALSQVSNEVAKNPKSSVGGFKGSGGIEASADLAIKLVPTEDMKTIQEKQKNHVPINIDLIITKNRHGIKGAFPMSFEGYTGKFYSGSETKI